METGLARIRLAALSCSRNEFSLVSEAWDCDDIPQSLQKQVLRTAQRRYHTEVPQTSDLPELQIFEALLAFDGREVLYTAELNFQRPYLIKAPM
jgi:hypothetical protein